MNSLRRFFTNSKSTLDLGRWTLKYDEKVLNRIVYLSGIVRIINICQPWGGLSSSRQPVYSLGSRRSPSNGLIKWFPQFLTLFALIGA